MHIAQLRRDQPLHLRSQIEASQANQPCSYLCGASCHRLLDADCSWGGRHSTHDYIEHIQLLDPARGYRRVHSEQSKVGIHKDQDARGCHTE